MCGTGTCRALQLASSACRATRACAALAHTAGALPELGHAGAPLLMRMLESMALLADLASLVLAARIEVAGLRGLLMLIAWADGRRPRLLARLTPYEAGPSAAFRFCRVEEMELTRGSRALLGARTLPWGEALAEFSLPLRAYRAFHGEGRLLARFPPWAVDDVNLLNVLPPPVPLPAALALQET